MFYTVYKITNLVNNKIYVGVHKTSNLEDDYIGSGKLIKLAIEKYGIENFKKEYISIFDNAEDMFKMESLIVNEEFVKGYDNYNLKQGGFGGFDYINSTLTLEQRKEFSKKGGEAYSEKLKTEEEFREKVSKQRSDTAKRLHSEGKINSFTGKEFLGKTHTEETKRKIGEANSKHQSGEGNSQFGTMWIHNLELKENKKIKKDEFSSWEQDGWMKGRKMKF